jgi:hypothetical protein
MVMLYILITVQNLFEGLRMPGPMPRHIADVRAPTPYMSSRLFQQAWLFWQQPHFLKHQAYFTKRLKIQVLLMNLTSHSGMHGHHIIIPLHPTLPPSLDLQRTLKKLCMGGVYDWREKCIQREQGDIMQARLHELH